MKKQEQEIQNRIEEIESAVITARQWQLKIAKTISEKEAEGKTCTWMKDSLRNVNSSLSSLIAELNDLI